MNQRTILAFLDELRKAKTFEDAVQSVLYEMLDAAKAALAQTPHAKNGRILRGMVHLRPEDGYRRLFVLDSTLGRTGSTHNHVPSASAWRWVEQHEGLVAIDVPIGRVCVVKDTAIQVLTEGGFSGNESIHRLTSR